jgi:UDP-glucose 4-epimerase
MKTILITGCAGLLGTNLSRHLLSKNYRVIGIDNFFGGYSNFLPTHENFTFYELNLESDDLTFIFNENKIDVVFHFAAYAAEGLSPFIRKFNYTNNVIASSNIINHCIINEIKLIFTSSMAVYGNQEVPFTELMRPLPVDPYGIAKYSVEQDIVCGSKQFGLKYNIIRPHNVLGIYQNIWDKYRNVIGIFIRRVLNNEPILIYGDGEQTRAFSDIKYYMEPFEKLIDGFDNEVYNIGADKHFKITEVAKLVKDISSKYGFSPRIEFVEPRHEVKDAYCDHTKAKKELGFFDETNIETLITEMFEWARSQPNREVKKMDYEIRKNIYKFWL